jgi:hypothetical protein
MTFVKWVKSSKITGFAEIAVCTSECQILDVIRTAMLAGNHMFNMQSDAGRGRLRSRTILAGVSCPFAH